MSILLVLVSPFNRTNQYFLLSVHKYLWCSNGSVCNLYAVVYFIINFLYILVSNKHIHSLCRPISQQENGLIRDANCSFFAVFSTFSSCKYLWFWAKCLRILFFFKDHFVYTSMETKWKILFFKPKYFFFSSSKILLASLAYELNLLCNPSHLN